MFSPVVRIVFAALSILIAVLRFVQGDIFSGLLGLAAAGGFIYGYFAYGSISLVWRHIQKGNLTKARKLLGNREPIRPQAKAFYHYAKGIFAYADGNYPLAVDEYKIAVAGNLRTTNNKSLVALQLANCYWKLGDRANAESYLQVAEQHQYREIVDVEIRDLREIIASNP